MACFSLSCLSLPRFPNPLLPSLSPSSLSFPSLSLSSSSTHLVVMCRSKKKPIIEPVIPPSPVYTPRLTAAEYFAKNKDPTHRAKEDDHRIYLDGYRKYGESGGPKPKPPTNDFMDYYFAYNRIDFILMKKVMVIETGNGPITEHGKEDPEKEVAPAAAKVTEVVAEVTEAVKVVKPRYFVDHIDTKDAMEFLVAGLGAKQLTKREVNVLDTILIIDGSGRIKSSYTIYIQTTNIKAAGERIEAAGAIYKSSEGFLDPYGYLWKFIKL